MVHGCLGQISVTKTLQFRLKTLGDNVLQFEHTFRLSHGIKTVIHFFLSITNSVCHSISFGATVVILYRPTALLY